MKNYLSSSNVYVYPCGNRNENYPLAKLTSEFNITNFIHKLIDKDGFVVNSTLRDTQGNLQDLEFWIHGYYFAVPATQIQNLIDSASASDDNIYGQIHIVTRSITSGSIGYDFQELANQNSDGTTLDDTSTSEFYGLKFVTTPTTSSGYYSLKLLQKNSDDWLIPEESRIRFTSDANQNTRSVFIDDGTL